MALPIRASLGNVKNATLENIKKMEIVALKEAGSSNDVAAQMLRGGEKTPFAVLVKRQTSGRGRLSRKWFSEEGKTLCVSVAADFSDMPSALMESATVRTGVAVCRTLSALCAEKLFVKWPNDLYSADGRKICGMLAELVQIGGAYKIVFGIGVNYDLSGCENKMPRDVFEKSADVLSRLCKKIPFDEFAKVVVGAVGEELARRDFSAVEQFGEFDFLRGKEISVSVGCNVFAGVARGVNERGNLLLELPDGGVKIINSGEATLRRK